MPDFTLPFPPSANRYWRYERNRIHRSDQALAYLAHVGLLCNTLAITPLAGDLSIALGFYRPAKRGDLDNYIKLTLDSLRTFAYYDDSQIKVILAGLYDDKKNPRVEVSVSPTFARLKGLQP